MPHNAKHHMERNIIDKERLGTSRHEDKQAHGGKAVFLHSIGTVTTYIFHVILFWAWMKDVGRRKASFEQAKELARDYLEKYMIDVGYSLWTIYTARSALARGFECNGNELAILPKRSMKDIKRGRKRTARQDAICNLYPIEVEALRSIGLRHWREMPNITADSFKERDGLLYCHIVGKGGRVRDALVLPEGRDAVEYLISQHPVGPIFINVPSDTNVHALRADYAARCFLYALIHGYISGRMYRCHDGSGRKYDTGALDFVNANLGHGAHRWYTAVYNYLSYGKAKS